MARPIPRIAPVTSTIVLLMPNTPIFLGGGAKEDNIHELMQYYDGVSVATWIKNGDMKNPIDPERAKIFIQEAKR